MLDQKIKARLFPDYGPGSPLWTPGHRVEWHELELGPSLRARLRAWNEDALHDTGRDLSDEDIVSEGFELARLLSDELQWTVTYEP
ncbi:MAG TPA: hypothetical protein VFW71_10405 [Actinomycetota bacterium]|nr:hypothetical protein [Actinomycetota bacterium]